MKKIVFLIVAIATFSSANAGQHLNRGMMIWQKVSDGQNYTNINDHVQALKTGGVFPGMSQDRMYGDKNAQVSVWKDYLLNTNAMATVSLASMTSALNAVNMATGSSLTNEFGGAYVDASIALTVLGSSWASTGDMPAYVPGKGSKIKFDTYHQNAEGKSGGYMDSIVRERHLLPSGWEQAIFINIPGYEPIPIRSCFCGNNISVSDILMFIKKKDEVVVPKPQPRSASTNCIPPTPDMPRSAATTCKTDNPSGLPQPAPTTAKGTTPSSMPQTAPTTAKGTTSTTPSSPSTAVTTPVVKTPVAAPKSSAYDF